MNQNYSISYAFFVGIDMSKEKFDVGILNSNGEKIAHKVFKNNYLGFEDCLIWIKSLVGDEQTIFVMEHTGLFSRLLWFFLQDLCSGEWQRNEEQTEHLQTGLMRLTPRPQIRTAQQGPIRSVLLARRTKRATDGLSGSPAAGLTCALPLRTWVCGGTWFSNLYYAVAMAAKAGGFCLHCGTGGTCAGS